MRKIGVAKEVAGVAPWPGDDNHLLRLPDAALKLTWPALTGAELRMFTLAMLQAKQLRQRVDGWMRLEARAVLIQCAFDGSGKRKRTDGQ